MTYQELLTETAAKKREAIRQINAALKGPAGFLVKAEIEKKPGSVAWHFLASDFCEKLAENIGDLLEQYDVDSLEAHEIFDIYAAYEDNDPDIYDLLPTEARLFD